MIDEKKTICYQIYNKKTALAERKFKFCKINYLTKLTADFLFSNAGCTLGNNRSSVY